MFELPKLSYSYDALEPYIDAQTMEIHHGKHHAAYTKKFNVALAEVGETTTDIFEIFSKMSSYPMGVRNNGGGYYNHAFFFEALSKNGGDMPTGDLLEAIEKDFGSYEAFRTKFVHAATTRFGSGWAWLCVDENDALFIVSTPNQDNSLMDIAEKKGTPLLVIDLWEHAYYLKYQNRRPEYIDAFFNVINWKMIEKRYENR